MWRVDLPGARVLEKRDCQRQLVDKLPILSVDRGVRRDSWRASVRQGDKTF